MLLSVPPAGAQTTDYDADNDGLIEIDTPAQLNAIRYDLDGDGAADNVGDATNYAAGFASPSANQCDDPSTTGTTETCAGYELTANISLSGYTNWTPIGGAYTATFEGNGHSVTNLTITNSTADDVGLFGSLGSSGIIRRVAVTGASVSGNTSGNQELGILVGEVSGGIIRFSYTTGSVTQNGTGNFNLTGGLVGYLTEGGRIDASYSTALVAGQSTGTPNSSATGGLVGRVGYNISASATGAIRASYASGAVSIGVPDTLIGGLVGFLGRGTVEYSYSTGAVSTAGTTTTIGGLIGDAFSATTTVTDSYYDSATSGQSDTGRGTGQTTAQLRQETSYGSGIYANWNVNVDGVAGNDDPWDFGTARHYPALQVDFDNDGTDGAYEFGRQGRRNPNPPPPPYNPAHDHPEIYTNARHQMATSCEVRTTGTGDDAKSTSTLTFNLGSYTRPITLALSLWDGDVFRSLQSQNINMPELRQEGQTATVEVVTDPAQTRFRLDSEYGLNLVLGYADCHTDDP